MPKAPVFLERVAEIGPEIIARLGEGLISGGTALALFTPQDDLHFATPGFMALYDVQPGPQTFNSMMRHCWETGCGPAIDTTDIDAWLAGANTKRRREINRQFEIDISDGRWMWISETMLDDGWIVLIITDFTSIKRREFRLQSDRDAAITASETDHLTGLYNRGATMSRFARLIERAITTGEIFSAILIDLDEFKAINDRFGHDGGDQVLVHFAACATESLRERDILGRVGGEEFLIIMPGATSTQACTVIERLQARLRDQRLALEGVAMRYTFSAGIAEWRRPKTLDTLYREADQALYAAKNAGRNQVKMAG
jgi:diguanylate cyclase (GGDEF)-like protein